METKAPIRHHGRQPDNLRVLLTRLHRTGTIKEVEVQEAPQDIVFEVLAVVLRVVDFDFQTIRVEKKYTMSAIFSTGLIVDRVVAVQIFSRWDSIAVSVPDGSRVISGVQSMRVGVFPKSVEIWVWRKGCPEVEVLALENQWRSTRVEENFSTRSRDSEAEWVCCVVESEPRA